MLGTGRFVDFLVPNCDPKREASVACVLYADAGAHLRPMAVCFYNDDKKIIHVGEIHRTQET